MKPVWRAEVAVDAALAQALVEGQFPELAPVSARMLAAGWDNTAYLINEAMVFRFPRREIAAPLMQTEIELLPWLSSRVPLRIPVPAYVGQPSERFGWPFVGYPLIAGEWLPAAGLTTRERIALAVPLAIFLRALHSIPADEARRHGAGPDVLDRLNTPSRRAATTERLTMLMEAGAIDNREQVEAVLDAAPVIVTPRSDTLVHGDLYGGQMIVSTTFPTLASLEPQAPTLAGVIDWGDVHVGDPAVDLAAVHATLPLESHDAFRRTYLPTDDVTWSAARARAAWHTIAVLASAVDTDNRDMTREAKQALAWIVGK